MQEQKIAWEAIENLKQKSLVEVNYLGIGEGPSLVDGLFVFNDHLKVPVEIRKSVRKEQIRKLQENYQDFPYWLLITEPLSANMQEFLKANQILFADTAGNAFIRLPEIFISIKGEKKESSTFQKGKLTYTHLKALFGLLLYPSWVNKSYRELEEKLGVGKASLSELFTFLNEKSYLEGENRSFRIEKLSELRHLWIEGFQQSILPKLTYKCYSFSPNLPKDDWKKWPISQRAWWSGEAALELKGDNLLPGEFILYSDMKPHYLIKTYKLRPNSEGVLKVFDWFWSMEVAKGFFNKRTVPDLLIYADVLASGKSRALDQARQLLNLNETNY